MHTYIIDAKILNILIPIVPIHALINIYLESSLLKSGGGGEARNRLLTTNDKLDQSTATLEQSRILLAQVN